MQKSGARHGPYYFWNRKVGGKLSSKSLSQDKLSLFRSWIHNRLEMESIVLQLLEVGQEIAATMPPATESEKSEKRTAAKRGK